MTKTPVRHLARQSWQNFPTREAAAIKACLAQTTGVDTWRSDLQGASITYAMLNSVPVNCVTCASKVWLQHVAHDHRKRQYDSRRHVAVATTPNIRLLVVIGRTYGNRQPLGLHIDR